MLLIEINLSLSSIDSNVIIDGTFYEKFPEQHENKCDFIDVTVLIEERIATEKKL